MHLAISPISFRSDFSGNIPEKDKTSSSKEKTVAVLGSSSSPDEIYDRLQAASLGDEARDKAVDDMLAYMDLCSKSTEALVKSGKNLVHGCGSKGIMGVTYESGANYSRKDENGKPVQNLAIIAGWPDEDTDRCVVLGKANNEADRIGKFAQVADTMLIFPGGTGTLQEAATFISNNHYGKPEDRRKVVLVGKEFFKGLTEQYDTLYKSGLINCPPEDLFTVVDTEEEILDLINNK